MNASLTAPSSLPQKRPIALLPLRLCASLATETVVFSLERQAKGHFGCHYFGDGLFDQSNLAHILLSFQLDLVSVV